MTGRARSNASWFTDGNNEIRHQPAAPRRVCRFRRLCRTGLAQSRCEPVSAHIPAESKNGLVQTAAQKSAGLQENGRRTRATRPAARANPRHRRRNCSAAQWARFRGMRGWGGRIRTSEWRYQKPLPYHLATPQYAAPSRTRRRSTQPPSDLAPRLAGRIPPQPAKSLLHRSRALAISRPPADRSVAQPGRAPRSGRGGRRFKSCHSDQNFPRYFK